MSGDPNPVARFRSGNKPTRESSLNWKILLEMRSARRFKQNISSRGRKKKNKGKQVEMSKGAGTGNGEGSLLEIRDSASERSYHKQNSSDEGEVQSVGFQESDVEVEKPAVGRLDEEKNMESLEENKMTEGPKEEVDWHAKFEKIQSQLNSCLLEENFLKDQILILREESSSKEESRKGAILKLEDSICRLQVQVNELEESRNRLVQENQLLISSISLLQDRVQQLEESTSVASTTKVNELEVSRNHLVHENQLLRNSISLLHDRIQQLEEATSVARTKVNGPHNGASDFYTFSANSLADLSSSNVPGKEIEQANLLEGHGHDDASGHAFESISIHDATRVSQFRDAETTLDAMKSPASQQPPAQAEIQVEDYDTGEGDVIEEDPTVPLSEAPLIGAPYRFISFVAKYVSGADLIKEKKTKIVR